MPRARRVNSTPVSSKPKKAPPRGRRATVVDDADDSFEIGTPTHTRPTQRVVSRNPIDEMVSDTLIKVRDGASCRDPFVEKLAQYYKQLDGPKRQTFQNKIVHEIKRVLVFLHELNGKDRGLFLYGFDWSIQTM